MPAPGRKYRGVELDPQTHNELITALGKPTYNVLQRVVSSNGYRNLPGPVQKWLLEKVVSSVRNNARLYWKARHPEIMREAQRKAQEMFMKGVSPLDESLGVF